jgi:hypothetical protein
METDQNGVAIFTITSTGKYQISTLWSGSYEPYSTTIDLTEFKDYEVEIELIPFPLIPIISTVSISMNIMNMLFLMFFLLLFFRQSRELLNSLKTYF